MATRKALEIDEPTLADGVPKAEAEHDVLEDRPARAVQGLVVHAVVGGGNPEREAGAVVRSEPAHGRLVGVGGGVVALVDDHETGVEPLQALGVGPSDALDPRNDHLALDRRARSAPLDADLEARGEGGDARGSLDQKLLPVGEHEAGGGVAPLELVDERREHGGLAAAGRHHHHHAVETSILGGEDGGERLLLVVAQDDGRDLARADEVVLSEEAVAHRREDLEGTAKGRIGIGRDSYCDHGTIAS